MHRFIRRVCLVSFVSVSLATVGKCVWFGIVPAGQRRKPPTTQNTDPAEHSDNRQRSTRSHSIRHRRLELLRLMTASPLSLHVKCEPTDAPTINNIHAIDVGLVCVALVWPFVVTGNDLEYIGRRRDRCVAHSRDKKWQMRMMLLCKVAHKMASVDSMFAARCTIVIYLLDRMLR